MENVLFTIATDNTLVVWAPINSWECHVLYQRASISMDPLEINGGLHPPASPSTKFCILLDSAELTRALETFFNKANGADVSTSNPSMDLSEIARKNPEICLVLNPNDDSLCIWGVDVRDTDVV